MRTLPYLSLLALLGLPACSSTVIDPSSAYTLRLATSGGFIGVDEVSTIDSANQTISFQAERQGKVEKADLSDAEMKALGDAIEEADVPGAVGSYRCSECADEDVFELDLENKGTNYHVTWDDIAGAPDGVDKLGREIGSLQASHFPEKLGN